METKMVHNFTSCDGQAETVPGRSGTGPGPKFRLSNFLFRIEQR